MGRVILTLPRLGETMEEAKVVDWLVAPGAAYRRGDVLLEVETDKTVVEVPALADGVLVTPLVSAGETVALGQPIAEVDAEGATEQSPAAAPADAGATPGSPATRPPAARTPALDAPSDRPAASPAARAAARRAGVDLALVAGSGRRGRITGDDVAAASGGATQATAVLIHGLFDHADGWRDLPRRLRAAGLPSVALDLPGHVPGAAPADDLEAAVDALAAALPQGRLVLVGHSLGAALATRLALRERHRVARLVLIAPAGLGARINADFIEGMLAAETAEALSRAMALLDAGPMSQAAVREELERVRAARHGHAALARAAAHRGFQQIDITGDLARLACPVSVVFGTADRVLDWQDVAFLPAEAAVHLVRGAGHLPHLAAPGLIVRLVAARAPAIPEAAHG